MKKLLPIPKADQLQAFAGGLAQVYRLLKEYLGDLKHAGDLRLYITITKDELASFLAVHVELAGQHLSSSEDPKYHESPVLERIVGGYRVYEVDHGRARDIHDFPDLANAAAEYLMWNWK
jgi:hypothetical protein